MIKAKKKDRNLSFDVFFLINNNRMGPFRFSSYSSNHDGKIDGKIDKGCGNDKRREERSSLSFL